MRKRGLAWTIFRPSIIYGPADISINVLSKIVRRAPFVPILGNGQSKIQPILTQERQKTEQAVQALAGVQDRELPATDIEAAVLDRSRPRRKFRRLDDGEISQILS